MDGADRIVGADYSTSTMAILDTEENEEKISDERKDLEFGPNEDDFGRNNQSLLFSHNLTDLSCPNQSKSSNHKRSSHMESFNQHR